MVNVVFTEKFERELKKIDTSVKEKVKKQIEKIIQTPDVGKPLRHDLKGERTVHVKPFRIIYSFFDETIYFLRFQHRGEVYG
jgi:addiction module RelE/StbE family toxin